MPIACHKTLSSSLRGIEGLAIALGGGIGLATAMPLIGILQAAGALRQAAALFGGEDVLWPQLWLLVWLNGTITGGLLAIAFVRRLLRPQAASGLAAHLLRLTVGGLCVAGFALLPLALLASTLGTKSETLRFYYLWAGGLIGWQPGVISFVFLYTFRMAQRQTSQKDLQENNTTRGH